MDSWLGSFDYRQALIFATKIDLYAASALIPIV